MATVPTTASHGFRPKTFGPTAATGPAKFVPITREKVGLANIFMSPLRISQSGGLMEVDATRTITALACGSGSLKAARCTSSGPP
jgi:hypothetical protein